MFDNAKDIRNQLPLRGERFLYESGIKMWWSTVIYFDQSEFSKMFFDLWAHIETITYPSHYNQRTYCKYYYT